MPRLRLVLAGVCAGMATASHPMGLIWIATLAVACLVAVRARGERAIAAIAPIAWMLLGAGLAMLPWILYAYAGWDDMIGQQRFVAHRWSLGDPWFYAWNVLMEWRRYISVGRGLQFGIPGAWLLVLCAVTGAAALVFGPRRHDVRLRVILAALLTGFLMLTLGDREKFFFYLAATVALDRPGRRDRHHGRHAIHIAHRPHRRDRAARARLPRRRPRRSASSRARRPRARHTRPSPIGWRRTCRATRECWRCRPGGSRWMPHVRDYRSLTVPMFFLDIDDPTGRTFTERLDAIDADVLLLDQAMIDYIHGPRATWAQGPGTRNPGAEELERFVETRSVRRIDLADPSYGRFEIHYLRDTDATAR